MNFVKGYVLESGSTVFEGDAIKIKTIQGVVVDGTIVKAANKKVEMQVEGEVETRTYSLDSIVEMVAGGEDFEDGVEEAIEE